MKQAILSRERATMNAVQLTGRLTKDPEVRYTPQGTAVARFSIAINKGKDKDGKDLGADYPTIVCFSKTAEIVEKYVKKGMMVGITGKITTSSYEKDGKKYYSTDVTASRVEFMEGKKETPEDKKKVETPEDVMSMFSMLEDEDIPF